jgi:hypothetical protein
MRIISFILSLSVAGAGLPAQDHHPAIAGTWKFEPSKSDRPNARSAGIPGREGSGGMPRDGNRNDPSSWGGFGAGESDPTAVMMLMRPPLELTIVAAESTWTITPERAPRYTVRPDAPATVDTLLNGTELISKARWKKDRLVVEREYKGLAKVKEIYWLDSDTGDLMVDVSVAPQGFPRRIQLRRVYARSDSH